MQIDKELLNYKLKLPEDEISTDGVFEKKTTPNSWFSSRNGFLI